MFSAPIKFMLYSQRNLAVRLLPDTSDCPEVVLPIHGLKAVKAIDFDPVQQYLYWVGSQYFFLLNTFCFLFRLKEKRILLKGR